MTASIVLVGAGPRAVAVTARLVADHAALASDVNLAIHLVDPVDVGAGRTWRRDQDRLLLNNTYCAETTVFADETVPTVGPAQPGPGLAEWASIVTADPAGFEPWVVAEAAMTRPWTFPTRSFQGRYFRWALDRVIASAPPSIRILEHGATVVALDEQGDGSQLVRLADGRDLRADVVVLLQGLLPASADDDGLADAAAASGLSYLPPGLVTERDWGALAEGEPVLVRGLGASFFDVLGLLFEGRGGRFVRRADGELEYRPSGREPRVIAGSRHGLPYRAKARYPGGLPEPVELSRFSATREQQLITAHAGSADVDFAATLADDLAADFAEVFEGAAARTGRLEPFDFDKLVFPASTHPFDSDDAWQRFLDSYFERELFCIRRPDDSPAKAVHRAMETARRRISRLVLAQVFDPVSVIRDLKMTLLPQSLVLASGAPPERLEQLVALRRAGLVEILGPGLEVELNAGRFLATTTVPGQQRAASMFAEARVSLGDLRRTDDPLINSLLRRGQARLHRARSATGAEVATATLDVTADQFLLIDCDGRPHPRRIVLGSPAGDVQWNAAIGAIPHTADKFLVGAERAAAYALTLLRSQLHADQANRVDCLPAHADDRRFDHPEERSFDHGEDHGDLSDRTIPASGNGSS